MRSHLILKETLKTTKFLTRFYPAILLNILIFYFLTIFNYFKFNIFFFGRASLNNTFDVSSLGKLHFINFIYLLYLLWVPSLKEHSQLVHMRIK